MSAATEYANRYQAARRARGVCVRCGDEPLVNKNHGERCRLLINERVQKSRDARLARLAEGRAEFPRRVEVSHRPLVDDDAKQEIRRSLDLLEEIAKRHSIPVAEVVRLRYGARRGEEARA